MPTVSNYIIVRHDTSLDGSGLSSSSSAWATFDYKTTCGSAYDTTFLGSVYDGHQYMYFIPGTGYPAKSIILRYDATVANTATTGFAPNALNCSGSYTAFDMATIGTGSGSPSWVGNGAVSNLKGMGGAVLAADSSGNVWLYIMPWNTVKHSYTNLTVGTTATRVIVGAWSGGSPGSGTFSASDFTAPSAQWEVFDMQTLSNNPQFVSNTWNSSPGATFNSGDLAGQSTLGGYQGGWYNSTTGMVIFSASISQFEVEHNPNHLLNDPTGWSLGLTDSAMHANEYLGGFVQGGTGLSTIYPSPAVPSLSLVQVSGM